MHFHVLQAFCNFALVLQLIETNWIGSLTKKIHVFPFHYRLILLVGLGYLLAINAMPAEDDDEGEEEEEEGEEGECSEPGGNWCWSLTDLLIQR